MLLHSQYSWRCSAEEKCSRKLGTARAAYVWEENWRCTTISVYLVQQKSSERPVYLLGSYSVMGILYRRLPQAKADTGTNLQEHQASELV